MFRRFRTQQGPSALELREQKELVARLKTPKLGYQDGLADMVKGAPLGQVVRISKIAREVIAMLEDPSKKE